MGNNVPGFDVDSMQPPGAAADVLPVGAASVARRALIDFILRGGGSRCSRCDFDRHHDAHQLPVLSRRCPQTGSALDPCRDSGIRLPRVTARPFLRLRGLLQFSQPSNGRLQQRAQDAHRSPGEAASDAFGNERRRPVDVDLVGIQPFAPLIPTVDLGRRSR